MINRGHALHLSCTLCIDCTQFSAQYVRCMGFLTCYVIGLNYSSIRPVTIFPWSMLFIIEFKISVLYLLDIYFF